MNPRIASERSDSGETRVVKICELIYESKFGIHDISRLKSKKPNEYYRLNMPFELGIDHGARIFGSEKLKQKKYLILEKASHEYHAAMSDISGMDIKTHDNKPENIIYSVRNWFYETAGIKSAEESEIIWWRYSEFLVYLAKTLEDKGFNQNEIIKTLKMMPIIEFIDRAKAWLLKIKIQISDP